MDRHNGLLIKYGNHIMTKEQATSRAIEKSLIWSNKIFYVLSDGLFHKVAKGSEYHPHSEVLLAYREGQDVSARFI